MPTYANTHTNAVLSGFAIARTTNPIDFIADKFLPSIMVDRDSDLFRMIDESNLRIDNAELDARGGANEVDFDYTTGSYKILQYGLKHFVNDKILRNADNDIKMRHLFSAIRVITDKLKLHKEKSCADKFFNVTTFSGYTTALGASEKFDNDTVNVIKILQTYSEQVRMNSSREPNTLIISKKVWNAISSNPSVLALLGSNKDKGLSIDGFQNLLQLSNIPIERILVGKAIYNSAKEGLTAVNTDVWGKYALLAYVDYGAMSELEMTLGKQFKQKGVPDFQSKIFKESEDQDGSWLKLTHQEGFGVTSAKCGYLLSTVIS